jgi:hypothetical protein
MPASVAAEVTTGFAYSAGAFHAHPFEYVSDF